MAKLTCQKNQQKKKKLFLTVRVDTLKIIDQSCRGETETFQNTSPQL